MSEWNCNERADFVQVAFLTQAEGSRPCGRLGPILIILTTSADPYENAL